MSASFALGLMMQVGFLTHQVAYLSPILGPIATAWAVSLTTSAAVAGRLLVGLFVDRCDRRVVALGNFLVQAAGTALLAANPSAQMLFLGCILFGLGVGNLVSLPGLIVQQEFPQQHFSRVVGLIVAINQFVFAFGPGLLGFLQQATGDYTSALVACFIVEVTAAMIVIFPRVSHLFGNRDKSRHASIRSPDGAS